jgi:hypothetical protein
MIAIETREDGKEFVDAVERNPGPAPIPIGTPAIKKDANLLKIKGRDRF